MDLQSLLESITPEIYESLKRAVELGKWPNGERLSSEQRELCLQAVLYYDTRNFSERERIGFIDREQHDHCGSEGDADHDHAHNRWAQEQILVFQDLKDQQTRH